MIIKATFNDTSPNWTTNAEMNRMFLRSHENFANHKLNACGFVFLNEIYHAIGVDRTSEGQIVGWLLGGDGDGYIDFGLDEIENPNEPVFQLVFNVDGVIYDKIDALREARSVKESS